MKRKKATEVDLDSPSSSSSPSREYSAQDLSKLKKQSEDKSTSSNQHSDMILEQDRFLPIANISRIMKRVIPSEGKLSKESKECVQECISEFLLFITSEASDKCSTEKRKTITGEDLIVAFQTLGFDDYVEPMKEFLHKYREANKLHNVKAEEPTLLSEPSSHSLANPADRNVIYLNPESSQHHHQPLVAANRAAVNKESQQLQQFTAPSTLQPMQIFFDPATGQHYVAMQGADGVSSLVPVNLTHAGLHLTINAGPLNGSDC